MKRAKLTTQSSRTFDSSFVRSIVLLCLVAHAALVTATHHHDLSFHSAACVPKLEAASQGEPANQQEPGGDANCFSCRLQRSFTSDINTPSLIIVLKTATVNRETLLATICSQDPFFIFSGRAPPTA
jgi:hypothetical protein